MKIKVINNLSVGFLEEKYKQTSDCLHAKNNTVYKWPAFHVLMLLSGIIHTLIHYGLVTSAPVGL